MTARMMAKCLSCGLALLAVTPCAVAAQQPEGMRERPERLQLEREGPEGRFDLVGFVGWLAPVADLTSDPSSFGTTVNPNPGFGVDGTYWFNRNFGLGIQGFWSPTELQVRGTEFQGAVPTDLGKVTYVTGSANLVYRPGVANAASTVQPLFSIGAGVRYLGVDDIAAPEVKSSTDPLGTAAAGVNVRVLGGLNIRADLRYSLSNYESPSTGQSTLQNDFLIVLGLGWRFH